MSASGTGHSGNPAHGPGDSPPGELLSAAEWKRVVEALELPPQQARIVALILHGMRDKQIAAALKLGVPTVRTYLARIFAHTGTSDRVELVLRVFRLARREKIPRAQGKLRHRR